MNTRMDEVWQAEQLQERSWQNTLAQDPDYLAWLDKLNQRTETNNGTHGESERRIDVHPGF